MRQRVREKNTRRVNFLVAGGSSHWCELNHYPAIRALKDEGIEAKVVAICDPIDPYSIDPNHYNVGRENLNAVLKSHKPAWINPVNHSPSKLKQILNEIVEEMNVDIVIVASNPIHHYFYADWAAERGINVLCDKPLVAVPDSSWKPEQALLIEKRFRNLLNKVQKVQKINPQYSFCTPLRRRALTPFVTIANDLQSIYERTGEGISYITAVVNGGVHRYPIEFLKGGAHGYIDGVGSLSHSSYHYLDVIAWYLRSAPGSVTRVKISLPYVSRVKDYVAKEGYRQLMQLNNEDPTTVKHNVKIPESALNAELDFTVHLHLYDRSDKSIGLIAYTSNHTTFSTRTTKYDPKMLDHTNDKDGGRMSQIYFDIHQGSVQNWQLIKNDVVFGRDTIDITQRLHPALGKIYTNQKFNDAYDKQTVTPKDLFVSFVKKSIGLPIPKTHEQHLQLLTGQELTHRIFSATYELIAQDYRNPDKKREITIELDKE